jgi:hypothetical protein
MYLVSVAGMTFSVTKQAAWVSNMQGVHDMLHRRAC